MLQITEREMYTIKHLPLHIQINCAGAKHPPYIPALIQVQISKSNSMQKQNSCTRRSSLPSLIPFITKPILMFILSRKSDRENIKGTKIMKILCC